MPVSYAESCERYENCVKNIQDSIYTLEAFMGSNLSFTCDIPQKLSNLNKVDVIREEKDVNLQIQALEEYRKVIKSET